MKSVILQFLQVSSVLKTSKYSLLSGEEKQYLCVGWGCEGGIHPRTLTDMILFKELVVVVIWGKHYIWFCIPYICSVLWWYLWKCGLLQHLLIT